MVELYELKVLPRSVKEQNRLRVLVVEDSEYDTILLVRELTQGGYSVTFERVHGEASLKGALTRGGWDVVLSDYTMPGFGGDDALALVRELDRELPFIFVSGTMGEDTAVAAMRSGADDYVLKHNLKRLVPAVERGLRDALVRRERKKAEERIIHLAYHDPLTDLANRSLFQDRLERAVAGARRGRETVALLLLDLNGFKAINDSLGHFVGDHVLQQVASRLQGTIREVDTIARLGGDEFAFVLPRADGDGAVIAARKLLNVLKQPIIVGEYSLVVTGSVGISWLPEHGANAETLLQKADIAMYAAKSAKVDYALYTPERDWRAHTRLSVITELRNAVERDEVILEYQPIVNLRSPATIGVEALARWRHPYRGVLPPDSFISVAEQTGLIEALTLHVIEKALSDWKTWFAHLAIPVAVNLSARNLQDPTLPSRINEILKAQGVSAAMLHFEITESFVTSDPSRASEYLGRLHDIGTEVSIDDFGTGYSSLSYLRQLPVDALKIDRSFVSGPTLDDAIIKCAIDLAHDLGLSVVAEGVESTAARDRLIQLKCDAAQGFHFAAPGPPRETLSWIEQQSSGAAAAHNRWP